MRTPSQKDNPHAIFDPHPPLLVHEMAQAVGMSHLYPAVPIMNFLAMVSMLLLIPGFWKTRIVALVALVAWLFLINLLNFIGMVHWRGHTNDSPVLASILTILRLATSCGLYTSSGCFVHFTWQRLQPLPVRKLYDTRRRNNLIHLFFALILPLLWMPLSLVSRPSRYGIGEDLGPLIYVREDWPGFVVSSLPPILSCATLGIFSVLVLVSYWQRKREDAGTCMLQPHSSVRTQKFLIMAVINMVLAMYIAYGQIISGLNFKWDPPTPLAENIASLQIVFVAARSDLDTWDNIPSMETGAILMPLLAFYVFASFGLGAEARNAYGEALLKLGRPIGVALREHWPHPSTLPFSWSTIAPWKANSQQRLSLVQPNAPQITPYFFIVPPDDDPGVPASPTRTQPSNSVENRIDVERQGGGPSRESARRLSIHKPLLAALNPANTVQSVSEVPLRRLSHREPRFVPLAPSNLPATATPGAPGSNPLRAAAANNIRRQGEFAPRPRARRLSYHKPAFVPLAPANANSAAPNALGATIPLVYIPKEIMGERNAVLRAENVVEECMPPPLLSSVSPSTPPPRFSTLPAATPAPPYRDVNPFVNHIL